MAEPAAKNSPPVSPRRIQEARKQYENRVAAPPPPPRRTAKDLLSERKRIDEQMALLDAAKAKAAAQRAEYGKFLTWKVTMQRKEREQREKEDEQLRTRVQAQLQEMLQAHKAKKRQELSKYLDYVRSPSPPAGRDGEADEDQSQQQQRGAGMTSSPSSAGAAHHAGNASSFNQPSSTTHSTSKTRKSRSAPLKLSKYELEEMEFEKKLKEQREENRRLVQERLRKSQLSTRGKQLHRSGIDPSMSASLQQQQQASLSAQPFDPSGIAVERLFYSIRAATEANESGGGPLPPTQSLEIGAFTPTAPKDAPLPAQQLRLDNVARNRHKTDSKVAVVASMFQEARNRRLYAINKMMSDPPADFLIGQDLLRYVPAHVMDAVNEPPVATSSRRAPRHGADDGSGFFLTSVGGTVDEHGAEDEAGGLMDPTEQHQSTSPREIGDPLRSRRNRVVRPFDRDAWMHLPEHPNTTVVSVRIPEEEQATLDWYYRFYEPMTGIKKRTDTHVNTQHSWMRSEKHRLPPKESYKFDAS